MSIYDENPRDDPPDPTPSPAPEKPPGAPSGPSGPAAPALTGDTGWPSPPAALPRRRHRLAWASGIAVAVVVAVGVAGNAIRLPYYAIAPGDAIDVNDKVTVDGAKRYEPDGEVLLLFVRQRARVNVWRWLQAAIDPDVDLYREEQFAGDETPEEVRDSSRADMAGSQFNAKIVALQRLGYELDVEGDGVRVLYSFETKPAGKVLREGDLITAIDGHRVATLDDVGEGIEKHTVGETVEVEFVRDGDTHTESVATAAAHGDGHPVIGVLLAPPYELPFEVDIDTSDIGGPSAGLAMTLAIIDELSPGELTGGTRVAVTGTIDQDGTVGPVGGVGQKAVAARTRDATLLLVPECRGEGSVLEDCERDVERARDRAGGVPVEEVGTLDDALVALERAGGDPVPSAASGSA